MSLDQVKYDAFISYRHCELDSFISENIHKKLESFKVPKSVIKKNPSMKTKIERVFRDEEELPLSSNLSDPISDALTNSDFLVVICTPRLKESLWCKKEIETFVAAHGREKVLLVLAEGEPEDSFPDILKYEDLQVKDENGNDVTVRVGREPLAADCRGENNKQRLKAMDTAILKLCAAIFGLNYDDLKQRHRERQIRRRLMIMTGALALVSVFAFTCLFFMIKIGKQNKLIEDKYASAMATASDSLLAEGLRMDSLYAVRNVLPEDPSKGYNTDAYCALVKALAPYETENTYFPGEVIKIPTETIGMYVSEDKTRLLIDTLNYTSLYDLATGEELARLRDEDFMVGAAILNDTGMVFAKEGENGLDIVYLDPETSERTVLSENGIYMEYSPENQTTVVFSTDRITAYRNLSSSFEIPLQKYGIQDDYYIESYYVSKDGKAGAFIIQDYYKTYICLLDFSKGRIDVRVTDDILEKTLISTDGDVVFVSYEETDLYSNGQESCKIMALDFASDRPGLVRELPSYGFYKMLMGDEGVLLVSDRLTYVVNPDLDIVSCITGYFDACCTFEYEGGFVLLDASGKMFVDGILPDDNRIFELYGINQGTRIALATYSGDSLFIKFTDSDSLVTYSRQGSASRVLGENDQFEEYPLYETEEIPTNHLEGIDEISVFNTEITSDGKYTIVCSMDGILYVFDQKTGKRIKELYNTDMLLTHDIIPYLVDAQVYIAEDCIFDRDFNLISRLPMSNGTSLGINGRDIILESRYSTDIFYVVPILSYKEMIGKADELLKDYTPSPKIRDKYNIE